MRPLTQSEVGWALIGLGAGVVLGIGGMLLDGIITRMHAGRPLPVQCLCPCQCDGAVAGEAER